MQSDADRTVSARVPVRTVAGVFLRLGLTSFGGPAAHVALMEEELVRKRRWLTRDEFLDLLGATNLIPGPNSTEMAIHIGRRVAGWPGFFAAGVGFTVPAVLIVTACAWAYVTYGSLPQFTAILYGVKPVVVAVIALAGWRLGRSCVKSWLLAAVGAGACALAAAGVHELAVLGAAGAVVVVLRRRPPTPALLVPAVPLLAGSGAAVAAATPFGLWPLFLVFLKVGSILFGSGYVLVAFLRADLVERRGWLTEDQLLDAIVVGQVTPGPVFTTATFIGYVLGGPAGAAVATVGIFLPAFVFVALSGPLVPRLRRSPTAGAFLDGVNVASLALLAVVAVQLARASVVDVPTALAAVVAMALLATGRVGATWLILAGAVLGLVARWVG
jgi:chromate transporter